MKIFQRLIADMRRRNRTRQFFRGSRYAFEAMESGGPGTIQRLINESNDKRDSTSADAFNDGMNAAIQLKMPGDLHERVDGIFADCRSCGRSYQILCEIEEFDPQYNFCCGSDRCLP